MVRSDLILGESHGDKIPCTGPRAIPGRQTIGSAPPALGGAASALQYYALKEFFPWDSHSII